MTKKILWKSFLIWLPFAALVVFASMLSYLLVQQDLRQTANDPQIQIAADVSAALSSGQVSPQDIIPPGQTVDIAASLDPYVILFDDSGKIIASSATLNGQAPTVPSGAFASVRQYGEDRFSWQPRPGVRGAVVVRSFTGTASSTGGFVLAGRSLREVEAREDNVLHLAELACLAGLVVMFLIVWAVVVCFHKKSVASNQ